MQLDPTLPRPPPPPAPEPQARVQCPPEHTQADRIAARCIPVQRRCQRSVMHQCVRLRCNCDAGQSAAAAEWKPALDDCCAWQSALGDTVCIARLQTAMQCQCNAAESGCCFAVQRGGAARVHDRAADAAALQSGECTSLELLLPAVLPACLAASLPAGNPATWPVVSVGAASSLHCC